MSNCENCLTLISINYNNINGLKRTIHSVNQQKHHRIQHIIIDGGSDDGSKEFLDTLQLSSAIDRTVVSENDNGIYDAMNKGLHHVRGDIVGFVNSGDILSDNLVLSDICDRFEKNSKLQAVYGNKSYANSAGRILRRWKPGKFKRFKYYLGWMTPHQATYIKSDIYLAEKFDERFAIAADYKLMLKLFFFDKLQAEYYDRDIVIMELGGVSNSSIKNIVRSNIEVLRAWRDYTYFVPYWIFVIKPLSKLFQFLKTRG